MTDKPAPPPPSAPASPSPKDQREARLAEALRTNLRRRKAAKPRAQGPDDR